MRLTGTFFQDPGGVPLDFAWRFAPGDGAGREQPGFDDSRWTPLRPALLRTDLGAGEWPGIGWFRRHILVDPAMQRRTLALRFEAPGVATVYLDGHLVLMTGGPRPELPAMRSDAALINFDGRQHVLAVRYVYPAAAEPRWDGIGFRLMLADPSLIERIPATAPWSLGLRGAMVALPLFLALLHFALFAFDPRARENLFYAVEMLAFAVITLHDFRMLLFPAHHDWTERLIHGVPIIATLFALLTYYAVRLKTFPATWKWFVGGGAVLFIASYLVKPEQNDYLWIGFFVAILGETMRIERSGRTEQREGSGFIMATYVLVAVAITLQILVNYDVIQSIAGIRQVYLFGIIGSAAGMSLYLARAMGHRRIVEVENGRKTDELTRARELQLSMLPQALPQVPGLEVAASTQTATEVGGDYYDVRTAGDGLLLAFGDATGHGLSSGIVVTAAKALFTSLPLEGSTAEHLAHCATAMRAMNLPALRMCLTLARITPREIALASAAMPPVLIHRRGSNAIEELGEGNLPLGSRLSEIYEEQSAPLAAGDTILFASDGLAEQTNAEGRPFGYDRVASALAESAVDGDAGTVLERLVAEAAKFRGAISLNDDMTFVVVRVL